MAEKTNITWAHHTASPWIGCTKVSEGCANCYAEEMDRNRFSRTMGGTKEQPQIHFGKGAPRWKSKGFRANVLRWDRNVAGTSIRPRVFPSLCDWLDPEVPIEWLADFLQIIHDTPNLDWLLLTKRPENFFDRVKDAHMSMQACSCDFETWIMQWLDGYPPDGVWFGVTVENQKRADERIPILMDIPAKIRWLSCEPLLEHVRLRFSKKCEHCGNDDGETGRCYCGMYTDPLINWIVIGGESGSNRRDCGVEAIHKLATQCQHEAIATYVKQDCAAKPGQQGRILTDIWALKQFPQT